MHFQVVFFFPPPFPLPPKLQAEPAGIESECLIAAKSSKRIEQAVKFSRKEALPSFFRVDGDIWAVPAGRGVLQSFSEADLATRCKWEFFELVIKRFEK